MDTLNPTGYSQVLDELVAGVVQKTYTYGLQRISENQLASGKWTPTFYGYDGHGNVRFLTSSTGTVGNTYQFDAFGMPVASTGTTANTYLYSGERFIQSIGLYHLRARYYNQATGRFETTDPEPHTIFNPGALHKYAYAQGNPVNRIDPSGHDAILEYAIMALDVKGLYDRAHFTSKIGYCDSMILINVSAILAGISNGGQGNLNCFYNGLREPVTTPFGWNPLPELPEE